MVLTIPFRTSDGLTVRSSRISTASSGSLFTALSCVAAGGGGGGGGGQISTGTDTTRFNTLFGFFGGCRECLAASLIFSFSSSEHRSDGELDNPLSCEFLSSFFGFSYFCGFGRNSLVRFSSVFCGSFFPSLGGVCLTITLQPELLELADPERLWLPESRLRDLMPVTRSFDDFDSSRAM